MENTPLRQLLRSLCHDLQWEYAVFWRLKHRSRMLLTWEDGYCNNPKPREIVQSISDNVHFSENTQFASFDSENDEFKGLSAGYPVELAVASMSCLLYSFGEGYVGRVASTGKHCWIFADEYNSKLDPEYPDEFHLQFGVGIKTILLVPVTPHGVMQLGSLKKVNEDSVLVAYIRDVFSTFQHNLGEAMLPTSNRDLPGPSSLTSTLLGKITSASTSNIQKPIQSKMDRENPMALHDIHVTMNKLSNSIPEMKLQFVGHNNLHVQDSSIDSSIDSRRDTAFGDLPMDSTAIPFMEYPISSANTLKRREPDAPNLSCQEEDLQFPSQFDFTEFAAHTNVTMDAFLFDGMLDQQFGETGMMTDQISSHGYLNFATDCELHKALGQALHKIDDEHRLNPNAYYEDVCSTSTLICQTDFDGGIEPSIGGSYEFFVRGGDADGLFDAMVSSMYDPSGDMSSFKPNSTRSPTISSRDITASCQTQSSSRCSLLRENELGPCNLVTGFVSEHENAVTRSPSKSSSRSTRSSLIDEEQQKGYGYTQSRKSTKSSHNSHKKAKHNDIQKPRPRDRQMIQDRVKELRELVPNAGKCSIDSLLDQTIKHMLFLRSVTDRAEKLKQCVYAEVVEDRRNCKSSENQCSENGASWAFELGSQFGVCPIVVKDLEQPGHMLIEMLCEENGLFLEIAQAIRRLELTILKGVMENRSEKSWAHFIVEASSGFRRMDIFWPLMQLLQRNSSIPRML